MNKALLFAAGFALLTSPALGQGSRRAANAGEVNAPYNPTIDPADFTHVISNKYYTLKPGMKAGYEKKAPKGVTRTQTDVTGETKPVMGVTALVVRNREWLNGQLVEDTRDWVAQDADGNVWYFGEAVDHYENGKVAGHEGTWQAGVDGAKPGIVMLNNPRAGDTYRQEFYPGKAEDMATVVAVGIRVTLPQGPSFENCVQIRDWNRIKPRAIEHKYYCVGVGVMVLEEKSTERLKLVTFSHGLRRMDDEQGGRRTAYWRTDRF
jgi:hypothetical protein